MSLEYYEITETLEVDVGNFRIIGSTFQAAASDDWVPFTCWYDNYWTLDHCEINQLGLDCSSDSAS